MFAANVSTQLNPTGVEALIQLLAPPPAASDATDDYTGALAGIVIACLLAVVLLSAVAVAAILFTVRHRRLKHIELL